MIFETFLSIIIMFLLIGMNILIVYVYSKNRLFPVVFMLFEIIFGMSIIAENEIMIVTLLFFSVVFNMAIINEQRMRD